MIRRDILDKPADVIANFDYFNDYDDTRRWLECAGRVYDLARLDIGYACWYEDRWGHHPKNLSILGGIHSPVSIVLHMMLIGDSQDDYVTRVWVRNVKVLKRSYAGMIQQRIISLVDSGDADNPRTPV